jgi:hypothetical protein
VATQLAEQLLQVGQRNLLAPLMAANATGPECSRSARSIMAVTAKRPLVVKRIEISSYGQASGWAVCPAGTTNPSDLVEYSGSRLIRSALTAEVPLAKGVFLGRGFD